MKTRVKFVRLGKEVLALLPDEVYNEELYGKTMIMSYMSVGQHGAASTGHLKKKSVSPKEYASLKKELESIGYKIKIIK